MKKLLNTLYVFTENAYLALDGENIIIKNDDKVLGRCPLHILENIISFSFYGASPALMGACAERGIGLSFYSPYGRYLGSVSGRAQGNVLLRKQQYRISDDMEKSGKYAANMLIGKVFNCRWVLERCVRDHKARVDDEKLKLISTRLKDGIIEIQRNESLDTLRGIEGKMSSEYFSVFDELIINQKDTFKFNGRNRRPPRDRVNAMLSFAYSLLAKDCANALCGVGLDSYVGFLHRDRPGRESLSLDLMEELRAPFADRFVLSLINLKKIKADDFEETQSDAVILSEKGRKVFLSAWQDRKKEKITHPYLQEKIEWGLVPHVQALLLARTIRGDLEEYPPFLWK